MTTEVPGNESLRLLRKADGIWLYIATPSGKKAMLNLTAGTRSPLVLAALDELAPGDDTRKRS